MATPVHTRIQKLRQLPPGRAHQAASNLARVAGPLGYDALTPYADAVREAARTYVGLRTRRFGERKARGEGAAAKIDRVVDVRVGFIYDTVARYAVDLPGTDEADIAERLLRRHFPRGLKAVVQAPYEEELIQVESIVRSLTGDEAEAARRLTITHHVAALEELLPRYAASLDKQERVSPAALKAAWQGVHTSVLELAFAVVILVRDEAHRARILAPIFEQDRRLAAVYASRQKGQSVDELDLDAEVEALEDTEEQAPAGEG